jgi:chemotaxis protein methyltransferase CheR
MSLSSADFEYIRKILQERSAIVLEAERAYLAETRLAMLARRKGFASLGDLMAKLRSGRHDDLHALAVEAMTNNETSFFRDVHPFEMLRQAIIPELLQRRSGEQRLHIWCGACSSGQEPYSIAMLLREHFPLPTGWKVRILATDLSREMLERARRGLYTQMDVNRGLPARLLVKYFHKKGQQWQLNDEIRSQVEVLPLNLIESWPVLPPLDIVFLRNVLIYFSVATKTKLLGKIRRVLRPDGYLFLGGAETTLNLDESFERIQRDRAGCYRQRQVQPAR